MLSTFLPGVLFVDTDRKNQVPRQLKYTTYLFLPHLRLGGPPRVKALTLP